MRDRTKNSPEMSALKLGEFRGYLKVKKTLGGGVRGNRRKNRKYAKNSSGEFLTLQKGEICTGQSGSLDYGKLPATGVMDLFGRVREGGNLFSSMN